MTHSSMQGLHPVPTMTTHNLNLPYRVTMDSLGVKGDGGEGQQLVPTSLVTSAPLSPQSSTPFVLP